MHEGRGNFSRSAESIVFTPESIEIPGANEGIVEMVGSSKGSTIGGKCVRMRVANTGVAGVGRERV